VAGHAIGDLANTVMVDAFEHALRDEVDPSARRFRIEHTQIIRPDDVTRMQRLGIIASMQPTCVSVGHIRIPWTEPFAQTWCACVGRRCE
jgi:predicted amidohydrolase YtcJ